MILDADGALRVGWYSLPDGRRFYGMGAADLREFCQKGWERQAALDRQLAAVLAEQAPMSGIGPAGRRQPVLVDLFAEADSW